MSDDMFSFLFVSTAALVSLAIFLIVRRVRHQSFLKLAQKLDMQYLKWELLDFPTSMLDPLGSWDKAQEVFRKSVPDGVVMFFTIEQGIGRQAYRRTIVARRYDVEKPHPQTSFMPEIKSLDYGRWRAVTRVRSFLGGATMQLSTIERAILWLG